MLKKVLGYAFLVSLVQIATATTQETAHQDYFNEMISHLSLIHI